MVKYFEDRYGSASTHKSLLVLKDENIIVSHVLEEASVSEILA